ncbi:hypothetical protein [Salirhabdus euzebyi]
MKNIYKNKGFYGLYFGYVKDIVIQVIGNMPKFVIFDTK